MNEFQMYPIGEHKRITPLADGSVMLTNGDVLAPNDAIKLTVDEQRLLMSVLERLLWRDRDPLVMLAREAGLIDD